MWDFKHFFETVTRTLYFTKIHKFIDFSAEIMVKFGSDQENCQILNGNGGKTIWSTTLLQVQTDCFGSQYSKKV